MQLKRISAILLVVALIFSVTSIFVGAEAVEAVESVEVGVEAETAAPVSSSPKIFNGSDEVSVKIRVNQNTGVTFLRFVIYFNSEALEYVDYKSDNLFNSQTESIQVRNGYLIYFLNLDSDVSEAKGDLMSINFKAKPGYCGDVEIYTELANKSDANCAKYHSSAKNTYVPFTAGKDSFEVHSVDVSKGVVTAPTCTENGFTTYECSNCKEKLIGNTVDKLGHVNAKPVEENRINSTCAEKGSYDSVVYCERCNTELSRNSVSIDALGHTEVVDAAKAPTCTETGLTEGKHCSVCNEVTVKQEIVEATGHTEVIDAAKAPTCTETGLTEGKRCSVCNEVIKAQETVPALGHALGEWVVVAPTCKAAGSRYRTCAVCNEKCDVKELSKLDDSSKRYSDVFSDAWYKNAVDYVSTKGLMNGMSADTFMPDTTMTRAMLVTVLYRMEGTPKVEGGNPFDDVKGGEWYSGAITWAAANGIVNGTSANSFAPMDEITREQMAAILYRYAGEYKKYDVSARADLTSFPDYKEVSDYAKDAFAWASSEGLVNGSDVGGKVILDARGNATRAQVATILMRFDLKFFK